MKNKALLLPTIGLFLLVTGGLLAQTIPPISLAQSDPANGVSGKRTTSPNSMNASRNVSPMEMDVQLIQKITSLEKIKNTDDKLNAATDLLRQLIEQRRLEHQMVALETQRMMGEMDRKMKRMQSDIQSLQNELREMQRPKPIPLK